MSGIVWKFCAEWDASGFTLNSMGLSDDEGLTSRRDQTPIRMFYVHTTMNATFSCVLLSAILDGPRSYQVGTNTVLLHPNVMSITKDDGVQWRRLAVPIPMTDFS